MPFIPGSTGGRLSSSTDVALNNPSNGNVLSYNTNTLKWTNNIPKNISGFFRVRYINGAWEHLTLQSALNAGMLITDTAVFRAPSDENPAPPSWMRADPDSWSQGAGPGSGTGTAILPELPASTSATNVTATTLRINWTPPANTATAQVTGYYVSWGGWTSNLLAAGDRFMDLTGFSAATLYNIEVWAVNATGRGPSRTQSVTTLANGGSGGGSASLLGLPAKVLGMYSTAWGPGINTATPPSNVNLQYMFHAVPSGSTGAFAWGYPLPTNRPATRADGCRLMLTVGGAGAGFTFTTRTQSQAFVNSITAINTQFGGTLTTPAFDGVDFNNFEAGSLPNLTEHRWISRELRTLFGQNFILTSPPAPWKEEDKTFCQGMLSTGDFSYVAPQFYDGPGLADPASIVSYVNEWVSQVAGGDAGKIVVGFGTNPGVANYSTPAQITSAWNTIKSQHPTIKGAFIWDRVGDSAQSYAATNALAPLVGATRQ